MLQTDTNHGEQKLVTARETKPFSLLTPRFLPPRAEQELEWCGIVQESSLDFFEILFSDISGPCVLDLETKGTEAWRDNTHIVGIGLAWGGDRSGRVYLPFSTMSPDSQQRILQWIATYKPGFIAHNAYFDFSFLWKVIGSFPNIVACTYGLYYQLANEGFKSQRWGLKQAQLDLLLWTETNEVELDQWLRDNGHVNKQGTPQKGMMYLAPPEILGKYCLMDVESTWLLYQEILLPVLEQFPDLVSYHKQEFLLLVRLLIEQNHRGIQLDIPLLTEHRDNLASKINELHLQFRQHEEVAPHIERLELDRLGRFLATEPPRYLVRKIGNEPPRIKKNGQQSIIWEKWKAKVDAPQVERKDWLEWRVKYHKVINKEIDDYQFNINSGDHLRWLFFDCLNKPVLIETDGGQPGISEDVLLCYGPAAKLLVEYRLAIKEQQYVESYLHLADSNGVLHPSWRVPGTLTGRLAGKDPNLQQCPKTIGTMQCFIPRPGYVWVDFDLSALEQVVLAELSGDSSLMKIYGPSAKPNDVYLFVGSQLPGIGEKIRAAGYDPESPTPDGIRAAKKECKTERQIAKMVVLASSYGAGPPKLHRSLTMAGIDIELWEVEDIHAMYWEIFNEVKAYHWKLEKKWRKSIGDHGVNGWVLNGVGRPICVDEAYKKDLTNRVVQSTGHDILLKYIKHWSDEMNKSGIEWYPVIVDWHDESIIEVREENAEVAMEIMAKVAFNKLNTELGGIIPLKGSGGIVHNLAEAKLEG